MQAVYKAYISPEEYLELEREAETKSEYYRGEVYAMAGASERHSTIQVNTLASLAVQLKGRSCKAHGSDLRVKVSHTGLYTYPDASVVCGPARFDDKQRNTLLNPTVVIEVLSELTEAYDRGRKFENCCSHCTKPLLLPHQPRDFQGRMGQLAHDASYLA